MAGMVTWVLIKAWVTVGGGGDARRGVHRKEGRKGKGGRAEIL